MSEKSAFLWVEIENFRGFRDRQRIDLDASAVLIHGPNGTGKTSFFDAVQWLLLGSLQRLEQWRVRKNDEHIVNRYRANEPAVVEAELEIAEGRVRLRRQGRYDSGFLEWHSDDGSIHGDDAERRLRAALTARPGQDMRRLLMTSALLQQDVVREVLEDKPAARYQQLAAMLGLDELGHFDSAVRKRAERLAGSGKAARNELETAEEVASGLKARLAAVGEDVPLADDVRVVRDRIAERLSRLAPTVRVSAVPSASAEAALLQQAASGAADSLSRFVRIGEDLAERRASTSAPETDEIARHERLLDAARQKADGARKASDAARAALDEATKRADELTALAVLALDLLGPECPVCGQEIDEAHVREHLQARIEDSAEADLSALVGAENRARAELADAIADLARQQEALAPLSSLRQRWREVVAEHARWKTEVSRFELPGHGAFEVEDLAAIRAGDVDAMRRAAEALSAVAKDAAELGAVLRSDASDTQLAELRSRLRRAEETVETLKEAARLASQQEETAKLLQRATTRAVTAVTEKRFKRLAPTVRDIYWRLDPHPSFTTLDFDLDVYNRRGIASPVVRDELENLDADPLLVFSSSQANVTALSYFLALGWAAGPDALPFVLLDDPLQSMDDVNSLGFADLCRHIRRRRQMVVSTHERRLASLLERKLTPRTAGERTRVVEFKGWTRAGPEIDQQLVEPQLTEGAERSVVRLGAA